MKDLYNLYTEDIHLARLSLKDIAGDNTQLLHWRLNLGDYNTIERLLKQKEETVLTKKEIVGLTYRILQKKGVENPWQDILNLDVKEKKEAMQKAAAGYLRLGGGIGDHLEDISRIKPWFRTNNLHMRIICTKERKQQLSTLLKEVNISITTEQKENSIPIKVLKAALGKKLPKPESFLREIKTKVRERGKGLLCNWVANGNEDKLSSWVRSVPFYQIQKFYMNLVKHGLDPNYICDISDWKLGEKKKLQRIGIKLYNPKTGSVYDLAKTIISYGDLISIDTSLIHLAAALDCNVHFLMPIYADERWITLLKRENSYTKNCRIIQQIKYGSWLNPMTILENIKFK